jgi:hypothetical protein
MADGKDPLHAADIEIGEGQRSGVRPLPNQKSGDEETTEDKEYVDTDKTASWPAKKVIRKDGQHSNRPHSLKVRTPTNRIGAGSAQLLGIARLRRRTHELPHFLNHKSDDLHNSPDLATRRRGLLGRTICQS